MAYCSCVGTHKPNCPNANQPDSLPPLKPGRGCAGGRSNGQGFGPDRVKRDWRAILLDEAQVTFWKLI
jgi:hypothetical protein